MSAVVRWAVAAAVLVALLASFACSSGPSEQAESAAASEPPAILLITLDTTRADVLGFDGTEAAKASTPHLDALANRGLRFSQAYTTAPLTLPAHASMLTGLYPAEHGLHENGRVLAEHHPMLGERLGELGYRTAAFPSGFPLERQFGLGRGFEHYDDDFGGVVLERDASDTTDRAIAWLRSHASDAVFAWVHYYDAHEPYSPPELFRSRYPEALYLGEIAFVDQELGRLIEAFEASRSQRPVRILVVGDHGEGLGDHGEALHGNLLYQGVMRVPLVVAGDGIGPGLRPEAVSVRRVFDTVLAWAGTDSSASLMSARPGVVLGEAMRPFLQYGWQPQVMAVGGGIKAIRSGALEIYDVLGDPGEQRDRSADLELDPEMRQALRDYPVPRLTGADTDSSAQAQLSAETRERLASLGYADLGGRARLRAEAPSARDMAHLFADLDLGSGLFVRGEYRRAIPVFERLQAADPDNLTVILRLAVARSVIGDGEQALALFERARRLDGAAVDVRHYLAMHYLRSGQWERAEALLESVLVQMPSRLPALQGLAEVRERQGRLDEARQLLLRVASLESDPFEVLIRLGELSMASADTDSAIGAFERARAERPREFAHFLELGVCYLASRRFEDAREALDQVPETHSGHPMALFKRAQVSVLLAEPDRLQRYRVAVERADATTRPLIENEPLFRELKTP